MSEALIGELKGKITTFEFSESGNHIFASNHEVACIFNQITHALVYKYETKKLGEDRWIAHASPSFIGDWFAVFTTGNLVICVDLLNGEEIFNVEDDSMGSIVVQNLPMVFKKIDFRHSQVLLNDFEIATFEHKGALSYHLSPDRSKLVIFDRAAEILHLTNVQDISKI